MKYVAYIMLLIGVSSLSHGLGIISGKNHATKTIRMEAVVHGHATYTNTVDGAAIWTWK